MTKQNETVTENVTETESAVVYTAADERVEGEAFNSCVCVKRQEYTVNKGKIKKQYFGYFVPFRIAGRDAKANIEPADRGGYQYLDLMFAAEDEDKASVVELWLIPYTMKSETISRPPFQPETKVENSKSVLDRYVPDEFTLTKIFNTSS